MYVIYLTHYLDSKGAIAPERGPARRMADFLTAVAANASAIDPTTCLDRPASSAASATSASSRPA